MVDKKSKIFFIVLVAVLMGSIGYTYYETVVLGRFEIFLTEDEIPTYPDFFTGVVSLIQPYVQ